MQVTIDPSWNTLLDREFRQPYFKQLTHFVNAQYATNTCYPESDLIFNAFNKCPLDKVKVVIIGQDPYHGPGQAHGLSFSVPSGVKLPPSLVNIYRELEEDLGITPNTSGDLTSWATQGVLLLNTTLTVCEGQPGSHMKQGWEQFTDAVIAKLAQKQEGIVFMLWGGYAKKKGKKISTHNHCVLETGHPSPLSANRGYWFGNKHFSKANAYLLARGDAAIRW